MGNSWPKLPHLCANGSWPSAQESNLYPLEFPSHAWSEPHCDEGWREVGRSTRYTPKTSTNDDPVKPEGNFCPDRFFVLKLMVTWSPILRKPLFFDFEFCRKIDGVPCYTCYMTWWLIGILASYDIVYNMISRVLCYQTFEDTSMIDKWLITFLYCIIQPKIIGDNCNPQQEHRLLS